jgi:hypothetical protein
MQGSHNRPGNFLVRLAQPDQFRFQFPGKARALQTLLIENDFRSHRFTFEAASWWPFCPSLQVH